MSQPATLTQLYFEAIDRLRDRPVLVRTKENGRWKDIGARAFEEDVRALSIGLRELGLVPGDRVALLSENRPEWAVTDYACLAARCADVPVY
ncbi:MAG TPA: AMP-binding protein, partial [Gemmatimonadales bacterium]